MLAETRTESVAGYVVAYGENVAGYVSAYTNEAA
jgi:hypothetical protein